MSKPNILSRVVSILAFGLAHLLAAAAPTNGQAAIIVPAASGILHDATRSAQTGRIEFSGDARLSGVLQAYWVPSWPDGKTEQRTLFLRFFPDRRSLGALPSIADDGRPPASPTIIQLYRGTPTAGDVFDTEFPLEAAIPILDRFFPSVPPEFFRYREGYALTHVRLRVQHLSSLIECDRRFFFSDFSSIGRTVADIPAFRQQETVRQAEQEAGCAGRAPYYEYYQLKPGAPDRSVVLRQTPDADSDAVMQLDAGSQVLKLRTVNDEWVEVEVLRSALPAAVKSAEQSSRGYVRRGELQVIN